ncbi:MAG: ABC transporter ATP-binding protein [Rudaea sp.]
MSPRTLVEVRGLGKKYPNVFHRRDRFKALLGLLAGRGDAKSTSVLRNVNLNVAAGESLGLIGENGAGKSTLLKLIVGVLTPSEGTVAVHGRIGALLELGAGFHPEYTGRENIALSAALYGLSDAELRAKSQEIVDFADIGRYIDEPIKHYSSGMIVRLGFAVVAALRPDLLITDEVLAVGDESFQKKCIAWLEDYIESGGTLILVSHSMYHVQKLCRHACWIKDGEIASSGDVFDVTQAYLAYQEKKVAKQDDAARSTIPNHAQEFYLLDFALNGHHEDIALVVTQNANLVVRVRVHSRDGRVPIIGIGLARADGTAVYGINSDMDSISPVRESIDCYRLEIEFDELPLLPGSYELRVHALDTEGVRLFDTMTRTLTVRGESRELGLIRLPHRWRDAVPLVGTPDHGARAS